MKANPKVHDGKVAKKRTRPAPPSVHSRRMLREPDPHADLTQDERNAMPPLQSDDFDRWLVIAVLRHNRSLIEENGVALLQAIAQCLDHGVSPPEWLAREFVIRMQAFLNFENASLDGAFDARPVTEDKRKIIAKRKRLIWPVSDAIMSALREDPTLPISPELFEKVGAKLAIGAKMCQELYAEGVEHYGTPDPKSYRRAMKSKR